MIDEMKRLPLRDFHEGRGAAWTETAGWEIPARYADLHKETDFFEKSAAVADVSFLQVISATGSDMAEYLNRRVSQKTVGLEPGDGRRATILDGIGKMQADLELFTAEDGFLITALPAPRLPDLIQELEKYVFTEDAIFRDVSDQHAVLGIQGPKTREVLAAADLPLPAEGKEFASSDSGVAVARSSNLFGGYFVLVPMDSAEEWARKLISAAENAGGGLAGFQALDRWRIFQGVGWWGRDLVTTTIPLEANLDAAIHHDKGCYPGQETIAKISNLGHPSRKLVRLDAQRRLAPGTELKDADGKTAGMVTSACEGTPPHMLGFVKWRCRQDGTELFADDVRVLVIDPQHI